MFHLFAKKKKIIYDHYAISVNYCVRSGNIYQIGEHISYSNEFTNDLRRTHSLLSCAVTSARIDPQKYQGESQCAMAN